MTDNWTEVRREVIEQPVSIELTRGQKGGYGWTIKIHEKNPEDCLALIMDADNILKEKYLRDYGGDNVDSK